MCVICVCHSLVNKVVNEEQDVLVLTAILMRSGHLNFLRFECNFVNTVF